MWKLVLRPSNSFSRNTINRHFLAAHTIGASSNFAPKCTEFDPHCMPIDAGGIVASIYWRSDLFNHFGFSSFPVVLAILWPFGHCKQKKFNKGSAQTTLLRIAFSPWKSPINLLFQWKCHLLNQPHFHTYTTSSRTVSWDTLIPF